MADRSVKDLMESKGFHREKFFDNEEIYADSDVMINFKDNNHTLAINDYRHWRFTVLDAEMIRLIYKACEMKGWFNDESDI